MWISLDETCRQAFFCSGMLVCKIMCNNYFRRAIDDQKKLRVSCQKMGIALFETLAVLVSLCVALPACCEDVHLSPVNCNETSSNLTLNDILNGGADSSTVYLLHAGTHCVRNFSYVQSLSNVTFSGNVSFPSQVTVTCVEGVGLGFVNVSGLRLEGLTIKSCGLTGEDNFQLFQSKINSFFAISVSDVIALMVGQVSNLTLSNFVVTETQGLGFLAVNLQGSTLIEASTFSYNHPPSCYRLPLHNHIQINATENNRTGGGAIIQYFNMDKNAPSSSLQIKDCNFSYNSYCGLETVLEQDYTADEHVYSLGAGGGLSLIVAQTDYSVDITITASHFHNNTSRYGGGAYIALFRGISNNTITFYDCVFMKNGLKDDFDEIKLYETSASALYLIKDLPFPKEQPFTTNHGPALSTHFLLQNCHFIANRATYAGAVYFYSLYSAIVQDTVTFTNCSFTGNEAVIGAAVYFEEQKQSGVQPGTSVMLKDVVFNNNKIVFHDPSNYFDTLSKTDSSAVIEVQSCNITFEGTSVISDNSASALRAVSSIINLRDSTTFSNNSGSFGGALNLVSSSFLVLKNNSHTRFENNTGAIQGGAFFINHLDNSPDVYYQDCFLYFEEVNLYCLKGDCFNIIHNLSITLELIENKSPLGAIMFGSTLDTCPWSIRLKEQYGYNLMYPVLNIMYHNMSEMFKFSSPPNSIKTVTTLSSNLVVSDYGVPKNISPGELFHINVTGYDRLNHSIPLIIASRLNENTSLDLGSPQFHFVTGNMSDNGSKVPVMITGGRNLTNVSVFLYATDSYSLTDFKVNLVDCPLGFKYEDGYCQCDTSKLKTYFIDCNTSSMTLTVPNGKWVGPAPNGQLMISDCILNFCDMGDHIIKPAMQNFDDQCRRHFNRRGILCGSCKEGYSTVLGSYRCKKCTNNYNLFLILFFALAGIIIVLAISFLRITISDGYLNTILFYCNIVYVNISTLDPGSQFSIAFIPMAWFNLEYGIEQCFLSDMTAMIHTALRFVFPLYLYLLILAVTLLANKSRKFSLVFSNAKFSGSKVFATLILMSYTSLLETCLEVLGVKTAKTLNNVHYSFWQTDPSQLYFTHWHIPLVIVSSIILICFIIPTPLLLIFPSLAFKTRLGVKIKPILDAFWAPFRTRVQFFAGVRLLLRFIPYINVFWIPRPGDLLLLGLFSIAVLFFEALICPFKSFMHNAFDFFLISNVIILVIGVLYFEISIAAYDENRNAFTSYRHQQYVYIACFLAFAYIAFSLIIARYIILRFPFLRKSLKMLILKLKRSRTKTNVNDSDTIPILAQNEDDSSSTSSMEDSYGSVRTKPKVEHYPVVVNYSELREPLLDEGFADLIGINSP